MQFEIAHIGTLVNDLNEALVSYRAMFPEEAVSEITYVADEGVKVCFIDIGKGNRIELVQPVNEQSIVYRFQKKGLTYYHLAYYVDNYNDAVKHLEDNGFRVIEVFMSEAFDNKRCCFMISLQFHLIELIER